MSRLVWKISGGLLAILTALFLFFWIPLSILSISIGGPAVPSSTDIAWEAVFVVFPAIFIGGLWWLLYRCQVS